MNLNNKIILLNTGTDNTLIKEHILDRINYPSFSLLNLESFLITHGYEVKLFDFYSRNYTKSEFINELNKFSNNLIAVCISTYTENIELSNNIISIIKKVFPFTKIIMGGPHVSFLPEEAFRIGSDYVVMFEGESTLITLLEHIKYPKYVPIEKIDGLAYQKKEKLIINPKRKFIKKLDFLPFKVLLRERDKTNRTIFLLTSRGCPGKCIFCASNAYSGRTYREYSAEWIYSFIFYYTNKYKIESVSIVDDTFTTNMNRLKRLFRYLKYSKIRLKWEARCRIDQLDEKFIKLLSSNGCTHLHIGVESVDQSVLNSTNKNYKISSLYNNFNKLLENGIRPRCSFIIGHHSDTLETIEQTLLFAYKIKSHNLGVVAIGISTPFPGTFLLKNATTLGINIELTKWKNYTLAKPIYSTENFSTDDLRRAYYIFHNEIEKLDQEGIISNSAQTEFRNKLNTWIQGLIVIKKRKYSNLP